MLTCINFAVGKHFSDHRPRPNLLSKFQTMHFTGHQWLKLKLTLCNYVLDALDCLNSFDFQLCSTTMFALTKAVAESILVNTYYVIQTRVGIPPAPKITAVLSAISPT